MTIAEQFEKHAATLPPVSAREIEEYGRYFDLLREWNEKINLVSRKSIDTSFAFHFADSVHLAELAHKHLGGRLYADLGTGAGFPGLVFAIRYPETKVMLFEKLAKRRSFLEAVVSELKLTNVRVLPNPPDARNRYLYTARAVFPPPELFAFMGKHLSTGGRLVVSVGGGKELEVPKGFTLLESLSYVLPEEAGSRKAVVVERST